MSDWTQASLTIAAPRELVLTVLGDLEAYPQWNDEFASVRVLARDPEGRPRSVRIRLESPALRDEFVLDYVWHGDAGMEWVLTEEGQVLRRLDGAYRLTDLGDGTTKVGYQLTVDVKVPLIGALKRKAEKTVIDRALRGLRQRVEETTWD